MVHRVRDSTSDSHLETLFGEEATIVVTDLISAATYERVALRDPDGQWELHEGQLREKPGMSVEHNQLMSELVFLLADQLERWANPVRSNSVRLRINERNFALPDVLVISAVAEQAPGGLRERLEVYSHPVPLVAEIWCPLAGSDYVSEKLAGYQQRGDQEIWRLHPYDRALTAWRRQPDGNSIESIYQGGAVEPEQLPGVVIDLDALFA